MKIQRATARVVSLSIAFACTTLNAAVYGQPFGGRDTADASLRTLAMRGERAKFIEALWSFAKSGADDASHWAYAALLADNVGCNQAAIELYKEIKKKFPADKRFNEVDKVIARIQKQEAETPESFMNSTSDEDFYLVDTMRKHIIRWNSSRLPIKVCIHESSSSDATPTEFLNISRQAFAEWSTESGNMFKFAFVPDPGASDIDVVWTRDKTKMTLAGKQGVTSYKWKDSHIDKSKIVCLVVGYVSDKQISPRSARHVITHEIGHALGLGHSKNYRDCMYFGNLTPDEDVRITNNDKRMLTELYTKSDQELEDSALAVVKKNNGPAYPMAAEMLHDWGSIAESGKDLQRAESLFRQEEQIYKTEPNTDSEHLYACLRGLSRVLRHQNKFDEAIPYYDRCASMVTASHGDNEDLVKIYENLSYCERKALRFADFKDTSTKLLTLLQKTKPDSEDLAACFGDLGWAAFNDREFAQSGQYYEKALAIYNAKGVHSELAKSIKQSQELVVSRMASTAYKEKIEQPFSGKGNVTDWYKANICYRDANTLAQAGNISEAMSMYQHAIAIYPYDSSYYYYLGSLLMKAGKNSEAAQAYAKSAALNTNSFSIAYWYAVALYKDHKVDEAKSAFEKAVNITHTPEQQSRIEPYLQQLGLQSAAPFK